MVAGKGLASFIQHSEWSSVVDVPQNHVLRQFSPEHSGPAVHWVDQSPTFGPLTGTIIYFR